MTCSRTCLPDPEETPRCLDSSAGDSVLKNETIPYTYAMSMRLSFMLGPNAWIQAWHRKPRKACATRLLLLSWSRSLLVGSSAPSRRLGYLAFNHATYQINCLRRLPPEVLRTVPQIHILSGCQSCHVTSLKVNTAFTPLLQATPFVQAWLCTPLLIYSRGSWLPERLK